MTDLQSVISTIKAILEAGLNSLTNKNTSNSTQSQHLTIHKIGLLAHLLVHELATEHWENLEATVDESDRRNALEQTDGVGHGKSQTLQQLLSVANAIKEERDMSLFTPERIGAEAAEALSVLNPSLAVFKDGKEIK